MKLLYIDGQKVDLYDEELIATSYAVNKIAELVDIQATFSNQFTVPATANNNKIFGFSNDIGSTSNQPYKVLKAEYIQNGIDVLVQGAAIIDSNNVDEYSIEVYAGLFDFFTQLGDKTLADIDFSSFDFILNAANIDTINQSGGALSYPLVNFGQLDNGIQAGKIDIRYIEPAFKISWLMDSIFSATTWGKRGEIFTSPKYTGLSMLLTGDPIINSDDVNTSRSFKVGTRGFIIPSPDNGNFGYNLLGDNFFDVLTEGDEYDSTAGWLDKTHGGSWRFTPKSQCIVQVNLNLYQFGGGGPIIITKGSLPNVNGGYRPVWTSQGLTPGILVALSSIPIVVQAGETLFISSYTSADFAPQQYFHNGAIEGDPSTLSTIEFLVTNSSSVDAPVVFNGKIDDMKQVDFVRNICNIFGIILQPDDENLQVVFKQFKQIRLDNKVVDWSKKLDLSVKPTISFHPDGYFQNNFMRWIQADTRGVIGDSSFPIGDLTLPISGDLFTLDFASALQNPEILPGIMGIKIQRYDKTVADPYVNDKAYDESDLVTYGGIIWIMINSNPQTGITPGTNNAVWQAYSDQFTFSTSTDPHMVYTRTVPVAGGITLIDGANSPVSISTMPVAWFSDGNQEFSLDFATLQANEWNAFIEMMNQYKLLMANFILTEQDIAVLDFFVMPYVEYYGERFYLNTVDEFMDSTQSTSCTLARI